LTGIKGGALSSTIDRGGAAWLSVAGETRVDESSADIIFERRGRLGLVTLTRPQALNALTQDMLLRLERQLRFWETDNDVRHVAIRGEGRAFSSGGDLMSLYEARANGLSQLPFFASEYRINAYIRRYPKPYIALYNGIAMGGGVGVSVHGSHRVVTENAIFAMPEVGIGFFPDVGGSYFLSRLPGAFGMYLGLTGARIRRGDMVWCGIATHAIEASRQEELTAGLIQSEAAAPVLDAFAEHTEPETGPADRATVAEVFSAPSLMETIARLEKRAGSDRFCETAFDSIMRKSPTSLAVAHRQISAGAKLSMEQCMAMEYRIVSRMLGGHDFFEGIRTAIVDKGDLPAWRPASISKLDSAAIDRYFSPADGGDLNL
jgi:enoyl-CoA hydratase/carnithine racemase